MIHSCFVRLLKQDWIWTHTFPAYRARTLNSFANKLAEALCLEPRQEIAMAQNNKKVLAARWFLKDLKVDGPHIQALKSELIAAKLGIRSEIFEENPGFEKFAVGSHLERYLLEYKHSIVVKAKKIFLKVNLNNAAVEKPWEEVKEILAGFKKIPSVPSQPWLYGPLGLQNKDMYDWQELRPFKWMDPSEWNTQYIFEACVFLTGSSRSLTGNHSWVRLRTVEGEVFSVGLYRTGKRGPNQHWKSPLRVMSGELMSPDLSEFWPGEVRSCQFAISREAFVKLKENIEEEKKRGTQPFEDFDPNCTRWVVEKAKIAGITLNASENLISLFTPRKVERIAQAVWKKVPLNEKFAAVARVPVAFAINCLQLVFGAGCVDAGLREKMAVRPRISSWKDLRDTRNSMAYHPYTLADKAMADIESWRKSEMERVSREGGPDVEKKLVEIAYGSP